MAMCLALSVQDASTRSQTPPPAPKPAPARAGAPMTETDALAQFQKQVEAYVTWRKSAAGSIGARLSPQASQAEIASREKALGEHIRKARATAKPGDIFNATAAKVFRRIVAADYKGRTPQKKKLADDEVPAFTITINQTYPPDAPLATFPATLLAKLPKLPEQVEYRIVNGALILRDIEANVIIDYVPSVMP